MLTETGSSSPWSRRHRRGFSFVELMMALALTGLVGLAAATLTMSMTSAWSAEQSVEQAFRLSSQRSRGYLSRLLREAVGIGYWESGTGGAAALFIWANDDFSGSGIMANDHQPQYGEMCLLQYDAGAQRVMLYTPKAYSAMNSTERSQAALTLSESEYLGDDTATAMAGFSWVRAHAVVGRSSAQTSVQSAQFQVDEGKGRTLVEYQFDLLVDGVSRTVLNSVALRQPFPSDDWDSTTALRSAAGG